MTDGSRTVRARADGSRVALGRAWAQRTKVALAAAGGVTFLAAALLARSSHAGQPKPPVHALVAPPHFVAVVRQNLLDAGLVAAAEAPASAATSTS